MNLIRTSQKLADRVDQLRFAAPVTHVYNPLVYARAPHEAYLERWGRAPKSVLLLGMNPGPFGMAQTGVPFGDVGLVRDWLGIEGRVGKPPLEHAKRPVLGFGCPRSEVSGARLWGWARERFVRPEFFFEQFFVVNYCPLAFMEASGRNRTPDKLPPHEREELFAACDQALNEVVEILRPSHVIGVGGFAEERARAALGTSVNISTILHPSPANPRANRGWAEAVAQKLRNPEYACPTGPERTTRSTRKMARGVDPNVMAKERARRAVLEVRLHRAMRLPAWLLPLALALVVVVEAAVLARQKPPAPQPFDAPNTEFSAERARRMLERFLGDGAPRPTGSAANARARERIIEELRSLGQPVNVESGMVCGRWGVCAQVNNVVARIPGREPGRAVLLAAHYDSVAAAPGAADDGSGVAALLEIARILKIAPPRRPVLLLFDDGEELGMLGAELFVRESRHFAEVDSVVNLEARGTSGPSLMFETSPGNAPLIEAFAGAVTRPITSSAFYEVYRRMPNDSDFSVFKARGLHGYNFAFIGGMAGYHTPRDELGKLSLMSLQHHGDNALSCMRALTENPSAAASGQDAVFFDVLGWRVVWWKSSLSAWFCGGAAFLLVLALAVGLLRGAIRGGAFVGSLLLVPVALALSALVAFGLELGLRSLGGLPTPWIAHPEATFAACVVLAIGCAAGLATAAGPEGGPALWGAIWTWFCVGSIAAFAKLPGTSFLFLVPTAAAGICGLPWFVLRSGSALWSALAALTPILATSLVWLPKLSMLYAAVGFFSLPAFTLAFAVPTATLAPLLTAPAASLQRALLLAAAILVPTAAATALWVPRTSREVPQRLSLAFHQDTDTRTARYLADVTWGPLPDAFQNAGFVFAPADPRPWAGVGRAVAASAPTLEIAAPEFSITSSETANNGRRMLRGRLRSPRGAPLIRLHLANAAEVRVRGVPASSRFEPPFHTHTFVVTEPDGLEIEIAIESGAALSGLLVDHSFDLPPGAQKLTGLRSDGAVPFHFGDVTIVSRGVRL